MQLRVARHTERLDELVRFYRDGLGLVEVGGFSDHDGYDGVFLEVPGTGPTSSSRRAARIAVRFRTPSRCWFCIWATRTRSRPSSPAWASSRSPPPTRTGTSTGPRSPDPDGFRVVLVPERWPS